MTINGRNYYSLPQTSTLSCFFFDHPAQVIARGEEQQQNRGSSRRRVVNVNILKTLYNDMQNHNVIVREAFCLGQQYRHMITNAEEQEGYVDDENDDDKWEFEDSEFELLLNQSTRYLGVGMIERGDNSAEHRVVRFKDKKQLWSQYNYYSVDRSQNGTIMLPVVI